ncbi:MAG TPA: DUF3341 domain-containing protein [Bacteroidia bacterium]|jgi:hypothetical protein|nr:DUF3341 domain-containing protein [Bacteroidia bacterium]
MSHTYVHALYDDDDRLKDGAKKVRNLGYSIKDVFSPFPVHGIDKIMGINRTRISICCFIYGCTGFSLAFWMISYMSVYDWPIDIGGKPNFTPYHNLPSWIPILFESTVLCAAHGMAITFLLRSWLLPGVSPKNPDPRTTDDHFLMIMPAYTDADIKTITSAAQETGAVEIKTVHA